MSMHESPKTSLKDEDPVDGRNVVGRNIMGHRRWDRSKGWVIRALIVLAALLAVAAVGLAGYATVEVHAFDASMATVYNVPVASVVRSNDAAELARGRHLAESVAPCVASSCHGKDLSGGNPIAMGPLATLRGSNITRTVREYSDGELARLLRHGIKKDGRSVTFMPVQDFAWLPDDDVAAIVSSIRTIPIVDRATEPTEIKVLGKVLDRKDKIIFDVARRIDHHAGVRAKGATPSVDYGQFLAMACQGCHGEHFSGGRIPGAPSSMAIPLNLTPDETGIGDWSFDDFNKLLDEGVRKNGKRLDPIMPYEAFGKYDGVERRAIWSFLRALPPLAFGNR
jgi:cytochrome c553